MKEHPSLDPRTLLQRIISGFECRHEWSEADYFRERRIICCKCGLHAHVIATSAGVAKAESGSSGVSRKARPGSIVGRRSEL
jgi:hypothetical protein